MKKTVFLRSTLRQPVHSLFLFLLLGVITFAFASRAGEALLIDREMDELIKEYRCVGTLVSTGDSSGIIIPDEVDGYLKTAPYVDFTDRRLSVSGVIQDGIYNAHNIVIGASSTAYYVADPDAERIFGSEVFFYGVYTGYTEAVSDTVARYFFTVDEVISGYPEFAPPGKLVFLYVDQEAFGDRDNRLKGEGRYLLRGSQDSFSKQEVGLIFPDAGASHYSWLPLAPDLDWFLPAEENLELSRPEYAQLVNRIEQSHDNACALDLTATADMSALPVVQSANISGSRYFLVDGRWLNREDDLNGNRVIVIHKGLAENRGLAVGDTVTLKLRDIGFWDEYLGIYFTNCNGYLTELQPIGREIPSQTETFEIVGIYDHSFSASMNMKGSAVYQWTYIPRSVYPEHFNIAFPDSDTSGLYSFVLDSPEHEDAFQDAAREDLAAMGYTAVFLENNYRSFKAATDGIGDSARSNTVIFAVILAVCFCLACFVYFRFRRRDLAISRALGVSAGRCVAAAVLPLVLVGGVGVAAGAAAAWGYTQANAESLLSKLAEAAGVEEAGAALPAASLILLILILIAALLVLALLFAVLAVRKPVLSQLQGGRNRK